MRKMVAVLALASTGCVPRPPAVAAPRAAVTVSASFGKTWNATIDEFAASNIPIKTMDRASGFIATDALAVSGHVPSVADCGKDALGIAGEYPTNATYNVVVRGDSTASTLRITVKWIRVGPSRGFMNQNTKVSEDCATTGKWETEAEGRIKAAAEAKR